MARSSLTSHQASVEIASNPFLTALGSRYGNRFEKWDSLTITYTLNRDDPSPGNSGVVAWTPELTRAIRLAHQDISEVSRIRFVEVADQRVGSDGADIDYWYYYDNPSSVAGYSWGVGGIGSFFNAASVYEKNGLTRNGLAYGGINYATVIHEILHNLGLEHPHDGTARFPGVSSAHDTGRAALNQMLYTVMSYNFVQQVDANGQTTTGYPYTYSTVDRSFATIGAFDIAMLQMLYGANMSHETGDTVYFLPSRNASGTHFEAIWDAGGTDEIIHWSTGNARIDLRAATLDPADGMRAGGMLSSAKGIHGGYTIAYGVVIENATGGWGNDVIIGNSAANRLDGRGGNDRISGLAGSDRLVGDEGNDLLQGQGGNDWIAGGEGADTLRGGRGDDWLDYAASSDGVSIDLAGRRASGGDAAKDVFSGFENVQGSGGHDSLLGSGKGNDLVGLGGADVIRGRGGNDLVRGAAGHDDLDGGSGFDMLDYRGSNGGVTVNLQRDNARGGHASGDSIADFEGVFGSARADRLIGDGGANKLFGGKGADLLKGAAGYDQISGGKGGDRMFGGNGTDTLDYSGSQQGVTVNLGSGRGFRGDAAGDRFSGFERVEGSRHADRLTGDGGGNLLKGGHGNDTLDGRGGDDVLKGQGDADTFLFNLGSDTLDGGQGRDHAYFRGDRSDFDVTHRGGSDWKVVDLSQGDTDILRSIEVLHFDDTVLT
ncbi:M10 family metallopeptidase [Sulfitobacter sp. LCG007]